MARDGAGNYSLPPEYLAITGATILATQHNAPLEDVAAALTGSVPRNGTAPMGANLPMAGFKITGLGDGSASGDALAKGQFDTFAATTLARSLDAKTANYTVLPADNGKGITVDATAGARTITLPAAATAGNGFKLIVKKVDASANAVTIDPNAAELLDGAATKVLRLTKQAAALICDGTAWHVLSDGSTFERGSNANGEYVRFADGTQICSHIDTGSTSAPLTWTFPAAFVAATAVFPLGADRSSSSNQPRVIGFTSITATSAQFMAMAPSGSLSGISMSLCAIGRWF